MISIDHKYAYQIGIGKDTMGIYRDFTVDPENEEALKEFLIVWFDPSFQLCDFGLTQDQINMLVPVMYLLKEKYLKGE
jgi:hypothetical protein